MERAGEFHSAPALGDAIRGRVPRRFLARRGILRAIAELIERAWDCACAGGQQMDSAGSLDSVGRTRGESFGGGFLLRALDGATGVDGVLAHADRSASRDGSMGGGV